VLRFLDESIQDNGLSSRETINESHRLLSLDPQLKEAVPKCPTVRKGKLKPIPFQKLKSPQDFSKG